MLSQGTIKQKLESAFNDRQASVLAEVVWESYEDRVTKEDFSELKSIVARLAESQDRTDESIKALTASQDRTDESIKALTASQDRTDESIKALTASQDRTDESIKALTASQDRTDERIKALTVSQDRTDERIKALTASQDRTEKRLDKLTVDVNRLTVNVDKLTVDVNRLTVNVDKLTDEHRETRRQLGGLSMTVGYTLEDRAYKALPALLERDYGIQVAGRLVRKYISLDDGRTLEVNILGEATRDGQPILIAGEAKSQLSKKNIDAYLKKVIKRLKPLYPDVFPLMVTYMVSGPEVEEYAREKGVALYMSYDFGF